tara:strand:- start:4003 stop:4605 length:603 start_codon:yes stop_codon:yes gene_type:complete
MASYQTIKHSINIEIKPELIGLVLGKGKNNFNKLKKENPNVIIKFFNDRGCIIFNLKSTSHNSLLKCERQLNNYIAQANSIYTNIQYKNKINKERQKRIKSNNAIKKLRDDITNQLNEKNKLENEIVNLNNDINTNNNINNDINNDINTNNKEYTENDNNTLKNKNIIKNYNKIQKDLEDSKSIQKNLKSNPFAGLEVSE